MANSLTVRGRMSSTIVRDEQHQADVKIVEATASTSCTLTRVHISMSAGQELFGYCLGTTSSHDHTSVCSTKHLFMRRVPHSPYMSTGREYLDAVCSRTLWNIMLPMNRVQTSSMSIFQTSPEHVLVALTVSTFWACHVLSSYRSHRKSSPSEHKN
jgi:hypothetical protein